MALVRFVVCFEFPAPLRLAGAQQRRLAAHPHPLALADGVMRLPSKRRSRGTVRKWQQPQRSCGMTALLSTAVVDGRVTLSASCALSCPFAAKPSRRRAAGNWTDDGDGSSKTTEAPPRAVSRSENVEEDADDGVSNRCVVNTPVW